MAHDTNFLIGKMPINLEKVNEYGLAVAIESDFALVFLDQWHLYHCSLKLDDMDYYSNNDDMEFGGDLVRFFAKELGFEDYAIIRLDYSFYGELYKNAQKTDEGGDINDLLKKLGVVVSDKEDEFNQLNLDEYRMGECFYWDGDSNWAKFHNNIIAGRIDRKEE